MVEPLSHRQPKGAANRYARPKTTAPHFDSTHSGRTAYGSFPVFTARTRPIGKVAKGSDFENRDADLHQREEPDLP
jgi:hypothetical protein